MRQLLLILFVLFQIKGYSQTSLSQDKSKLIRSIKVDAIKTINSYEGILNNKTKNYKDLYDLFSDSATVFCDILPANKLNTTLSLEDYFRVATKAHKRQEVKIQINEINIISEIDTSEVLVKLLIQKDISSTTRNGIHYSDEFSNIAVYLKYTSKVNEYEELTFNTTIDSIVVKDKVLPVYQIAYIVDRDSTYRLNESNKLKVNSKLIDQSIDWIGGGNTYFFIDANSNRNLKYDISNAPFCFGLTKLKKSEEKSFIAFKSVKNKILLKIRRPRFNVTSFYNQSNFKLINSNIHGVFNDSSLNQAKELGLHLGYYIKYSPDYYISVSTGLSQLSLNSNFNLFNYSYSYFDVDPSGNNYLSKVKINSLHEEQDIQVYTLPLSLKYGFRIEDKYEDFGLEKVSQYLPEFVYLNISGAYNIFNKPSYTSSANISYSGFYEDDFGIEISDNGVYNFGEFDLFFQEPLSLNNYISSSVTFGCQKKLSQNKDKLFINLEYTLSTNISDPLVSSKDVISVSYNELNSVSNLLDSFFIKRNFFNFGITYNF